MTDHQQRSAEQLFKDKAVTLAQTGQDVQVMCNSAEDAEVVFNWLERQIAAPQQPITPPFPSQCCVTALRDTMAIMPEPEVEFVSDADMCLESQAYRVTACAWWPDHGWCLKVLDEWFNANDFELAAEVLPVSQSAVTYTPKHSDAVFRFNDVVEFMFTHLPEKDRIGRLVQVRKGCGQFGSDMYFIRRASGVLITGENCKLRHSESEMVPIDPTDTPTTEYSIRGEYPEVGFVVEAPKQPQTPPVAFGMMITRDP